MEKFKFTEEQKKGLIPYLSSIESSTNMQIFIKMKELLNRIFGEDNNQIIKPTLENLENIISTYSAQTRSYLTPLHANELIRSMRDNINYQILIRFPEVTIKNSRAKSMVLKDLFVCIPANPNGTLKGRLEGVRTTFTPEQYTCGYIHSHLRSFNPAEGPYLSVFCLGTGQIAMPLAILCNKFDELNFQFLCHHLKNYVAWESIEGTPYCYMGNVLDKMTPSVDKLLSDGEITNISEAAVNKLINFTDPDSILNIIKYEVTNKGIKVNPTNELEIILAEMVPKKAVCYKDSSGKYYAEGKRKPTPNVNNKDRPILFFKGEPIKINFSDEQKEEKKEIYANPAVTKSVCGHLSREFTRTAVRAQGTQWHEDPALNIQQTTNANPLALQKSQ